MDSKSSIGALWRRTSKKGGTYYSGKITVNGVTEELVGFDNEDATPENKQPSIKLYRSEPREQGKKVEDSGDSVLDPF